MMTIHHVTQQYDNPDRSEERFSRVDWPPRESCDYTGHYAECWQQDNVDFRMTKKPPDMIPENRTPGRGGEEGGPEKPVSLEHNETRDERGEGPEKLQHGPEGEHCKHRQLDKADTTSSMPENRD